MLLLALSCGALKAEMVTRRWGRPAKAAPKKAEGQLVQPSTTKPREHAAEIFPCQGGEGVVRFDLSGLPKNARIYRADLLIFRTAEITGAAAEALIDIEVYPVLHKSEVSAKGGFRVEGKQVVYAERVRVSESVRRRKPLRLRPPWFDRFDATEAVRSWASRKANACFFVKACPRWDAQATCLDVAYEGKAQSVPPQAKRLSVSHRAGQTFIVFEEIDARSAEPSPTWAELKGRLEKMDAVRVVRYRVYRHSAPITAASLPEAELLGEVEPMSAYNARGRSVDLLIALHRRRAIGDTGLAKRLARNNYFARYNPDMPEMGEVHIQRLAIEEGKPLPPKVGLYVHHPRQAARAYYAVVSVVDGVANARDFSPANSLAKPIEETVGLGEPVLQGKADVTVFFDYPGERLHYVQWAAPPLSNLPNQYYNWGVFVPRGYRKAKVRRLSVFFHGARQRYLKPPWPHRRDTALLSPHDAPYRSYGHGYHEALGTLRSFGQGKVRPFFARRVDAMLDWALRKFGADPGRVSCGGRGPWGGTAALQYGLRRPGRIAYVMAEDSPDADPQQTPYEYSHYGRGDKRKTRRPDMDAVWGRAGWRVPAESGKPIWEEMNLVAYVLANGRKRTLPYLSLGAGSMHLTWKQETDLMKACLSTRNAFMAEFFWGSSAHKHLPVTADQGDHPFEPRADRPLLACNPKDRHPNPKFFQKQFLTGKRGYSSGSRLNTRPRWHPEEIVDAPDRLEMTIYSARRIVHAGRVTCDVVVRNTQKFRPKPGEKLAWTAPDPRGRNKKQRGEATVDENGLILIRDLGFGAPGRLIVRRVGEKGGEQ